MPSNDSDAGGSSESEVIFEDNGDYIETNLITEEDLKSYRLHVATQEGSKGAPLNEALPAIELAKIIYKRRKLKEDAKEVEERENSIEKLKDKLKKKKKKKNKSRSKSPSSKKDRQYREKKTNSKSRSKSPKLAKKIKSKSKSPKPLKRIKSKSKSKSPKKSKRSKSKSPKRSSRPRKSSRSNSRSRNKSKRRSRSRNRDSGHRSHNRRRRRSRSRSRGRSRRHRKKLWESKSKSRSRSDSRDKDDYVRKCKSIQDGPDLPVSRPVDRRKRRRSRSRSRHRSSSSSVERPPRGLPSSSSYLAIEGPEMDKALVTLYPSATPSLAAPTLDRVRLPPVLAQQLFPVSCGSDHKTEESEKAAASVLAIEGPKEKGKAEEEKEEGELKPPPSLSEIMQMRIEANKLLLKDPHDLAAKKILHEAQILMNQWQSSTVRNAGGRYTGAPLTTPLPKELLDSHHPLTWARKDMFMNLAPLTESPGIAMMMKMGWSSGQGLGKEGTGDVNPLQLAVKTDRKGLMTGQEVIKKNPAAERGANVVGCNWVLKIVNGKHAVSGLGEIHQHIGRPCPEYIDHPSTGVHQITAKTAWGQFTPPSVAPSKKESKGRAALWALKKILAIEADKYNQTCPEEAPTSTVMSILFKTTTPGQNAKYNANFNDPNKVYIDVKNVSAALAQENADQHAAARPSLPPGIPHLRPPAQHGGAAHHRPQQTPCSNTGTSHQASIASLISSQRIAAENLSNRPPVRREPLMAVSEHRLPIRQPRPRGPPPSRFGGPPPSRPRGSPPAPPRMGGPPSRLGGPPPRMSGPPPPRLGGPPPPRMGGPPPPRMGGPPPLRMGGPPPPRMGGPPPPRMGGPPPPRLGGPPQPYQPARPPLPRSSASTPPMIPGAKPIQGNIQQMIAMATKITGHMRPPPPR